jgi:hypothetical protein
VPPIPDPPLDDSGSSSNRESLDYDITVLVMPRIAEGYFVAWKNDELMSWGRMGQTAFPTGADTIALNPADYRRLKAAEARFEAEESAHGHA